MRKHGRLLVALVTVPSILGCYQLAPVAVPASPTQREDLDVRGVVVGGEEIRFEEVRDVSWTTDQIFIVGRQLTDDGPQEVTRQFALASLSSLLVNQLDAGKTSAMVGGALVGTIAVLTAVLSGSDPRVAFGPGGG